MIAWIVVEAPAAVWVLGGLIVAGLAFSMGIRPRSPKAVPNQRPPAGHRQGDGLLECEDCGGAVSRMATACPHCGRRSAGSLTAYRSGGCAVQLVGLALLFWFPIGTLLGVALLVFGGQLARVGRRPGLSPADLVVLGLIAWAMVEVSPVLWQAFIWAF